MKLLHRRLIAATGGALWMTLINVSAQAEDIELFIGGQDDVNAAQPNILLILDDSGSMDAEVASQVDYDPDVTFDGTCARDRVYWVEHQGGRGQPEPPSADQCASTDRWISLESLVCREALNAFEAEDGGTYTDRMAQYDSGSGHQGERWKEISSTFNDRLVECDDDWGQHGDGSDPDRVYPQNGDADDLWTSRQRDGIRWGRGRGGGTGAFYTLYHGNYVNWLNGPGQDSTRIEIMQEVAVNLINSIGGVNIGLMSFNFSEGGLVNHALEDVSAGRSSLIGAVNDLRPGNWTPLSETLYEAHQYFRGASVVYGAAGDEAAFDPNDPSRYESAMQFTCQKNHVVLLTDGEPTRDRSADDRIVSLVDAEGRSFSDLTGNSACDTEDYPDGVAPDGGRCLDDLAAYMHAADLSSALEGRQNVTTHTVGFLTDLPVLEQTAVRGGGDYYTANDTGSLTSALTSIVTNVLQTQSTFVAPAVSVNAFNQTRNLNDLYFSVFQPSDSAHWPGNLKKYRLRANDSTIVDANANAAVDPSTGFFADGAQSFWSETPDGPMVQSGGAASRIPNPRTVFTYLGGADLTASGNRISTDNPGITDEHLGTGVSGGPTRAEVIAFINGLDPADIDNDGNTDEPRRQMGDPLHSRPATVIYGPTNEDGRIFFATNDGYLHSIDSETGAEQWAFVPEEFLGNQAELMVDNATANKIYGIDGNVAVQMLADRDNVIDGDEKVYLFFGMRRGGGFYYGLDVSNPDSPKVLWRLDASDLPGIGQSWSTPVPTRIDIDGASQNDDNMVLVIGGGYDPNQDNFTSSPDSSGNAIYIVDSETGDLLWHASSADADLNLSAANGSNATMEYSIPADVKVVDINSDGFADRLYAADMGGQIWRFDVFNGSAADDLVTGGAVAQLGAAGLADPSPADTRRFYNTPDAAFVSTDEQAFMHIGIGSGYRSHPNSTDNQDRFYALRDYGAFTWRSQDGFDSLEPLADSDFVDISGDASADVAPGSPGWKLELAAGEKVLAEATTFDGDVFFSTYRPGTTGDSCNPALGVNRQYRVSLLHGSPVTNLDGEVDEDGDGEPDPLTAEDRFTESAGSILSRTTVVFVGGDEDDGEGGIDGTRAIGCTETDCSDLDFDPSPRRTFWTQDSVE